MIISKVLLFLLLVNPILSMCIVINLIFKNRALNRRNIALFQLYKQNVHLGTTYRLPTKQGQQEQNNDIEQLWKKSYICRHLPKYSRDGKV